MNHNFLVKWGAFLSIAAAGAWIRIPHAVQILMICMGFDILSGLFAAIANRRLNSSIMLRGLMQKAIIFPVLAMLHYVEEPLKLSFEFETVAACFFILMEGMSIIENAARSGLEIPTVIIKAFAKAKIQTTDDADEIHREFTIGDKSKLSVGNSTEIVKTPDPLPDLKVDKKITVLEEQHVTPIPPKV